MLSEQGQDNFYILIFYIFKIYFLKKLNFSRKTLKEYKYLQHMVGLLISLDDRVHPTGNEGR